MVQKFLLVNSSAKNFNYSTNQPKGLTCPQTTRLRRTQRTRTYFKLTKDRAWSLARLDMSEYPTSINMNPYDQTMPAWKETNAFLYENDISKKSVGFILPYIIYMEYSSTWTNAKRPVTCDEGVYHIAR